MKPQIEYVDGKPAFVRFVIEGQAFSKANRRRHVTDRAGRPMSIKSKDAIAFFHACALQCPNLTPPFDVPVGMHLRMFYPDERSDLDESVVLDALQSTFIGSGKNKRMVRSGCYLNDRLVRGRIVLHGIDAKRPRVEVSIVTLPAFHLSLALGGLFPAPAIKEE